MGGLPRHPWHPAVVHFPIACWMLAALADVAGTLVELPAIPGLAWPAFSHALLWAGVLLAVAAISAGIVDYLRLPSDLQESPELSRHVVAMGTAWLAFLAAGLWRVRSGAFDDAAAWGVTLLELAGCACLVVGGRFAAVLVFQRMTGSAGAE